MGDEEEEIPELTELELKVQSIAEQYAIVRKPLLLKKELWEDQMKKIDDDISLLMAEPKATADTAVDTAEKVGANEEISLIHAKGRARFAACIANLEELDYQIHLTQLAEAREVEAARLALEPPEE